MKLKRIFKHTVVGGFGFGFGERLETLGRPCRLIADGSSPYT